VSEEFAIRLHTPRVSCKDEQVLDRSIVWPLFRRGSASNIPEEFLIRAPTERMHVVKVLVQR
jgi:hypothetical protein